MKAYKKLDKAEDLIEEVIQLLDGIDYKPGCCCTENSAKLRRAQNLISEVVLIDQIGRY
jgi:hypothetical protein